MSRRRNTLLALTVSGSSVMSKVTSPGGVAPLLGSCTEPLPTRLPWASRMLIDHVMLSPPNGAVHGKTIGLLPVRPPTLRGPITGDRTVVPSIAAMSFQLVAVSGDVDACCLS